MLVERLRNLLLFARRRKTSAATRADDAGILPTGGLPGSSAVTVHVSTLGDDAPTRIRAGFGDILDYLIGFVIIAVISYYASGWKLFAPSETPTHPAAPSASSGSKPAEADRWPAWLRSLADAVAPTPERDPKANLVAHPDTPPLPTQIVPVSYTAEARNAGFHARVLVTVYVDSNGVPRLMEPAVPIPYGLEQPIRQAVLQWRFRPAFAKGAPVASKTVVNVPFR